MSRPNSFQPIWPPQSADCFDGLPEMREAKKMFVEQMRALEELNDHAAQTTSDADICTLAREIAAMLHDISGTAAYFGEAAFGDFAGTMEPPVLAAQTAAAMHPLCATIGARMDMVK